MLFYRFPSKAISLLSRLINKKIVKVKRQILISDIELYQDVEQSDDGPVEIQLQNGLILHFISYPERYSIVLKEGPMPDWGEFYKKMDVSHTHFWHQRLNKPITRIVLLEHSDSVDLCEFGIEIYIKEADPFIIEYINEEEWPDMIRITDYYDDLAFSRTILPTNITMNTKLYPSCLEKITDYYKIPSEAITLLSCLKGEKIVKVKRQILRSDTFLEDFEQKGDGPVEIRLKNGFSFHIMSDMERGSILIQDGPMPDCGEFYKEFDVSHTRFWKKRLNKPIIQVVLLKSSDVRKENPCEFGMEIWLNKSIGFTVQYVNQEPSSDVLVITEEYKGIACNKHQIFHIEPDILKECHST